jgi:hypothetical protein
MYWKQNHLGYLSRWFNIKTILISNSQSIQVVVNIETLLISFFFTPKKILIISPPRNLCWRRDNWSVSPHHFSSFLLLFNWWSFKFWHFVHFSFLRSSFRRSFIIKRVRSFEVLSFEILKKKSFTLTSIN